MLQQLPLSYLSSLLREIIEYDYGFPAERTEIERELSTLASLSANQLQEWFHAFAQIRITAALEQEDWVNQPAHFLESLSSYLWSSHQMDRFRETAQAFGTRMQATRKSISAPPIPRLGVAVIGQGVENYEGRFFERLRPHGTLFSGLDPANGLQQILDAFSARAATHAEPYGHWYVDGGVTAQHSPDVVSVSYAELRPARRTLLQYIAQQVSQPGMGPEQLRSNLIRLQPENLGMKGDPVLNRFQIKLLTEGSGTQIFSTTFAQWTAREVLRRAQAVSLLVRYAPRQRQRPMHELLSDKPGDDSVDPLGSLIDADMGAYYQWIDQQRLPAADRSVFIAWFEGHSTAIAVGPVMPRGVESRSRMDLGTLLRHSLG
ncbi:hypothetical protein [Terriglobus roseus]|uniref:hypothetical protein n=1 Tax=Terriglobus roseus TaxID=392734 RepID=UPI001FE0DC73|nr:hypothetical protein [Terriglobus roseus]